VSSIHPGAAIGSEIRVTVEGSGFDAEAAVVEVYDLGGRRVTVGTITSRSRTRMVATLPLAGAAPGGYTVRVANPDGARSDGVTLSLSSEIAVTPRSGPPGTVFVYTGRGFRGAYGVISHLEAPTGLEWQAKRFPTTPAGTFEHPILSAEFRPGTYTVWAQDDATGIKAPPVTFEVTAPAR